MSLSPGNIPQDWSQLARIARTLLQLPRASSCPTQRPLGQLLSTVPREFPCLVPSPEPLLLSLIPCSSSSGPDSSGTSPPQSSPVLAPIPPRPNPALVLLLQAVAPGSSTSVLLLPWTSCPWTPPALDNLPWITSPPAPQTTVPRSSPPQSISSPWQLLLRTLLLP